MAGASTFNVYASASVMDVLNDPEIRARTQTQTVHANRDYQTKKVKRDDRIAEGRNRHILHMRSEWSWQQSHLVRVFLLLSILVVVQTIYTYWFMYLEADAYDDNIESRVAAEERINATLAEYGVPLSRRETLYSEFEIVNSYSKDNPWRDFGKIFNLMTEIGTTVGYGNIVPATDNGKWLVTYGSIILIMICSSLFVQMFLLERVAFKFFMRFLDRYGLVFSRWKCQLIHLCLLTFYLVSCCYLLDISSDIFHRNATDRHYAYVQVLSSIGFGDVVIESDIFFLYVIPIGLFPMFLIYLVDVVDDIFYWCFRPVAINTVGLISQTTSKVSENFNLNEIIDFFNSADLKDSDHGFQVSRTEIYGRRVSFDEKTKHLNLDKFQGDADGFDDVQEDVGLFENMPSNASTLDPAMTPGRTPKVAPLKCDFDDNLQESPTIDFKVAMTSGVIQKPAEVVTGDEELGHGVIPMPLKKSETIELQTMSMASNEGGEDVGMRGIKRDPSNSDMADR